MRRLATLVRPLLFVSLACSLAACGSSSEPAPEPKAATPADAFVWGYPLVVTERTMQSLGGVFGVNHLINQLSLSNAQTRVIVSPNQDTMYSAAVVDLRSEPVVLTVPDVSDRYWTYQFLDAWTSTFHYIGTRATNGKGGTFVIAPAGWKGQLPAGATLITSPTAQMFLLGRYLVKDDADVANVTALDRKLQPLSKFENTAPPAPPPSLGKEPGGAGDTGKNGAPFFDELGDALAIDTPVTPEDQAALASFAAFGVGPGLHPHAKASDPKADQALAASTSEGLARIVAAAGASATAVNGWVVHLDIGKDPSDTLLRAAVANFAWGANLPEEAVYAASSGEKSGEAYTGKKSYVMHFDAKDLPPVEPK